MNNYNFNQRKIKKNKKNKILKFDDDPSKLFNKNICIVGPSGSGKSTIARYILSQLRDIPHIFLFCAGQTNITDYGRIIDKECIYSDDEITSGLIKTFLDHLSELAGTQMKKLEFIYNTIDRYFFNNPSLTLKYNFNRNDFFQMFKEFKKKGFYKYVNPKYSDYIKIMFNFIKNKIKNGSLNSDYLTIFADHRKILIFDDVMNEVWFTALKGKPLTNLLVRGRHSYCTSIYIIQSYKALGPVARGNYQYIFFLGSISLFDNFYELVKDIDPMENKKDFKKKLFSLFKNITSIKDDGSRGSLVVSSDKTSSSITDVVNFFEVPKSAFDSPNYSFDRILFNKNFIFKLIFLEERKNANKKKNKDFY